MRAKAQEDMRRDLQELVAAADESELHAQRLVREVLVPLAEALADLSAGMYAGKGNSSPRVPGHEVKRAHDALALVKKYAEE